MLSVQGRRYLSALLTTVVTATGCDASSHRASHVPSAVSTALLPASQVPCHRAPGKESCDGPLEWKSEGTFTVSHTWLASRPQDDGIMTVGPSEPIVLDYVTTAPQDPALFAPVKVLGAWITDEGESLEMVDPGKFPGRKKPVHCQEVAPEPHPLDQRVLVVRLDPVVGAAAKGRKWAADQGIVIHYHTLDGTPYASPFAYVDVYPTSPKEDSGEGFDLLNKLWFESQHASAAAASGVHSDVHHAPTEQTVVTVAP